jgi:hypothetical protein
MSTKVITYGNIPTKPPLYQTIVVWLCLDRFEAPEWGWAVFATLAVLIWIICFYLIYKEETVDIFKKEEAEA